MSELVRLIFSALVADVVDSSAGNPCLLTLANASPQRLSSGNLLPATTVGAAGVLAGVLALPVVSTANIRGGQELFVGGPNPESVYVAPTGATGSSVALTSALRFAHPAGALVSALPSILTQQEPRTPITSQDAYWRAVLGPTHEMPDPSLKQRAPVREYEAFTFVKVYDSSPSRLVAERVLDRLDYLLNLGDANCNGNPSPLLGSSPLIYLNSLELGSSPEPFYEPTTQVTQFPMALRAVFTKTYP